MNMLSELAVFWRGCDFRQAALKPNLKLNANEKIENSCPSWATRKPPELAQGKRAILAEFLLAESLDTMPETMGNTQPQGVVRPRLEINGTAGLKAATTTK